MNTPNDQILNYNLMTRLTELININAWYLLQSKCRKEQGMIFFKAVWAVV